MSHKHMADVRARKRLDNEDQRREHRAVGGSGEVVDTATVVFRIVSANTIRTAQRCPRSMDSLLTESGRDDYRGYVSCTGSQWLDATSFATVCLTCPELHSYP